MEESKLETNFGPERWAKFVDDKNSFGVIIPITDATKNLERHIRPEDAIPSEYNSENVPKYRLMNRKDRRK